MKGGYKLVSLKNKNFDIDGSSNTHTIKGIYDAIENNYHKNVLLCDIIINDVERVERFVTFGLNGTTYTGYLTINDATNYVITITDEDVVTIAFG